VIHVIVIAYHPSLLYHIATSSIEIFFNAGITAMALCDTCQNFSRILLGGGGLYPEQFHIGRRNSHLGRARDIVASATSCSLCNLLLEYVIAPAVEGFELRDARQKLKDWLADAPIIVRPCNDVPRHTRDSPLAEQEYLTGFKLEVPLIEGSPKLDTSELEVDVWAEEGERSHA
jgi:hypothetical protein